MGEGRSERKGMKLLINISETSENFKLLKLLFDDARWHARVCIVLDACGCHRGQALEQFCWRCETQSPGCYGGMHALAHPLGIACMLGL